MSGRLRRRQGFGRNLSTAIAIALIIAVVGMIIQGRPNPDQPTRWFVNKILVFIIVCGVSLNLMIQVGMLAKLARDAMSSAKSFSVRIAYFQLVVAVVGFFVGTSLGYWMLSKHPNACTNQQLNVIDSWYFTMTSMTSTGFGDIVPTTSFCRSLVTVQMGSTFLALTIGVSQLIAFTSEYRQRQQG